MTDQPKTEDRQAALMRDLASLHDIPLRVSIELGRTSVKIRDLLQLKPNQVIPLRKAAGEPLEICVNGHYVARGEVIASEQASGIRIIEVLRPGSSMTGPTT